MINLIANCILVSMMIGWTINAASENVRHYMPKWVWYFNVIMANVAGFVLVYRLT